MADQQNSLPQAPVPDDLSAYRIDPEGAEEILSEAGSLSPELENPELDVLKPVEEVILPETPAAEPFAASELPQYSYPPQAQQTQYGYQQPQYGYAQPQQPPYGYQPQQAYTRQAFPGSPLAGGTRTHRQAPVSKAMVIASLVLLLITVHYYLPKTVIDYIDLEEYSDYDWAKPKLTAMGRSILSCFPLILSAVFMTIGAIRGSRGFVFFGAGVLILIVYILFSDLINQLESAASLTGSGIILFAACALLSVGILLAGIGCLLRVNGLKTVGAILMLVGLAGRLSQSLKELSSYEGIDILMGFLGMSGFVLLSSAVLCFPLVKPRAK